MLMVLVVLALIGIAFGKDAASAIFAAGLFVVSALIVFVVGAIIVTLFPAVGVGMMVVAGGSLGIWGLTRITAVVAYEQKKEEARIADEANKKEQQVRLKYLQVDLDGEDGFNVFKACRALSDKGWFNLALPILRTALYETSETKRFCAIDGLAQSDKENAKRCVEMLLERLNDSAESPRVRAKAARELSSLGTIDNLPILLQHLKDADGEVRGSCCYGVGGVLKQLQGAKRVYHEADIQRAVLRLVKILNTDSYTPARMSAAQALGEIKEARALRSLQAVADNSDLAYQLQQTAASAADSIRVSTRL